MSKKTQQRRRSMDEAPRYVIGLYKSRDRPFKYKC